MKTVTDTPTPIEFTVELANGGYKTRDIFILICLYLIGVGCSFLLARWLAYPSNSDHGED